MMCHLKNKSDRYHAFFERDLGKLGEKCRFLIKTFATFDTGVKFCFNFI